MEEVPDFNSRSQQWFDDEIASLEAAMTLTAKDVLWRVGETAKHIASILIDRHSQTSPVGASLNRRGPGDNPFTMKLPDNWGNTRHT